MTIVSTATAAPRTSPHVSVNRPNPVSVGTIVWLASELMFFAGLFAMYFTLRGADPEAWAENTPKLNITFAAINTTVLVLDLVDLGSNGVGDALGAHVQPGVDALDADAGDPGGQGEQLASQRAAADDDDPGRDGLRPRWHVVRR